ncbi:hypothetical protein HDE_00822 [Halotydeus destructor]|nr:hypothetical protein HDE_00822 [Halotydeus destructor]
MVSITDVRSLLLLQLGSKEQSKENNWELFCNKVQKNDKFWSETFHRALVTYHKLSDVYNEIGCTIPSVDELAVSTATPFPEFTIYLAAGASKASSTLRAKSRLISQTVVHLLSQETTAEISLPLRSLLDLIGRLLSIPLSHARAKSAVDIGALVDVAPYLHIDAFSILEAVILSLGKTLATEASFINQLFVHLLCSTDKDTDGKLLKVRQKGLHVLSKWSIIMDTFAGFSPKDLETIVMGLIPNIKPKPKVVKLLAATAANKHKKGHKGRAHLILGDMQDATNSVTDDDVELAVAALTVFHAIFSCSYVYVNARLYIHAVQNIMEELMTVYRRKDNVSGLHEHSRVRLSLLKVLKALLLIPAFRFSRSVPIEPSLVLFADAVNSEPNLEIKLFLLESLNSISLLLHHAETDSHMSEDAVKQVAEAEVVEPEDLSTAETVDSSVSTEQGDVSLPKS